MRWQTTKLSVCVVLALLSSPLSCDDDSDGNRPPTAAPDSYAVDEDQSLVVTATTVLANDSDPEGSALTASLVADVSNGVLVFNSDGLFTYTPNADFSGTDSFTYRASDGSRNSSPATVTITVNAVNDTPTASDDSHGTDEDQTLTVVAPGVLGNDGDVDSDPLSAVLSTDVSDGTLTLNADGSFDYVPTADFAGTDSFTYVANDGTVDSVTATVTITVSAVDDPPDAVDDAHSVDEDDTLNVAAPGVLGNDTDAEGAGLSAILENDAAEGTLTLNADGSFTYTPGADFNGPDSFKYKANDGGLDSVAATVDIDVVSIDDEPVGQSESYSTDEDTQLTVNAPGVLDNDSDADGDALSAAIVNTTPNGTLSLSADGSFTYDPDPNWFGTDSFEYCATDGSFSSPNVTVTITVNAVNDAPTVGDDGYPTDEDTQLTVIAPGVLSNDSDVEGTTLSVSLITDVTNGSLTLNTDGSFTYTPDTNYNGLDSFQYEASDGDLPSATATVTITIGAIDDRPVAVDDSYSVDEDDILTVLATGVLSNDTDAEGATLSVVPDGGVTNGILTLNGDGSFTYEPDADFDGTDSFTYYANDGGQNSLFAATVTITVAPVNDAPEATGDSYNVDEDDDLVVSIPGVLGNDSDVDDSQIDTVLVDNVSNGSLTLSSNGSFNYSPNADYFGPDSFTYKANDGELDSAEVTVNITVNSINDAPVANDDSYSVDEDGTLTVLAPGVLDNDSDTETSPLSAVSCGGQTDGSLTLNLDGSFTYTPNADFNGSDSFTYLANDGTDDSPTAAIVTITINAVNDAPEADDQTVWTGEGTPVDITLTASDTESDPIVSWNVGTPGSGTLSGTAPNLTYTPNADFDGQDSFTFTASDAWDESASATVTVNVAACPVEIDLVNAEPVDVYDTLEFRIKIDPDEMSLGILSPSEMFNAYDTGRDIIRVAVVVSTTVKTADQVKTLIETYESNAAGGSPSASAAIYGSDTFIIPAFYARYASSDSILEPVGGSWRWRARVCLVDDGPHFFYPTVRITPQGSSTEAYPDPVAGVNVLWRYDEFHVSRYPHDGSPLTVEVPESTVVGPVKPITGGHGRYLHRAKWNGSTSVDELFFGLGFCRCWNMMDTDIPLEGVNRWSSAYLSFDTQMTELKAAGGNLFSWWLASWDSSPVHYMDGPAYDVYNEYWDENTDGKYELNPITADADVASEPHRFFDQGRCKKVDELFDAAEAHGISVMLTLWPHPDLRETGTGWDSWTNWARSGDSYMYRTGHWLTDTVNIGGTDPVTPNGRYTGWSTLAAGPVALATTWSGTTRAYQKNFFRYVVARWGCRRGLGLYELVSEIGGTPISLTQESTWRNRLSQFVGAVSPYKQSISSAAHNITNTLAADITDGEYISTHGYCIVDDLVHPTTGMNDDHIDGGLLLLDNDAYRDSFMVEHVASYSSLITHNKPVFCGEVGACQRRPGTEQPLPDTVRDLPAALTHLGAQSEEVKGDGAVESRYRKAVTTFHYTVWVSVLCGGAAAPLAWTDGKEFGEMTSRSGAGQFEAGNYEIDYYRDLLACATVLQETGLETQLAGMTPTSDNQSGLRVLILKGEDSALVWISRDSHDPDDDSTAISVNLNSALSFGESDVTWYNPWTGAEVDSSASYSNLNNVDTRLHRVYFNRACAGSPAADGTGPHEQEDVLLWITKSP